MCADRRDVNHRVGRMTVECDQLSSLRGLLRLATGLMIALLLLTPGAGALAQAPQANYLLEIDAPSELLEPLRTRTLLGRWRLEPDFEPAQLDLFIERLREEGLLIAQAAGYFSAKVTVEKQAPRPAGAVLRDGTSTAQRRGAAPWGGSLLRSGEPGADRLVPLVRVVIDAGARTTVNLVRLELTGEAAEVTGFREKLFADWPLPEGTFFESAGWENGKRRMLEVLQQGGYLRARVVQSRALVNPELTVASLSVMIDSGPRLRFGGAQISGVSRYPRSIVEDLMPWERGDLYAFDALQTLQDRLRADGHYSSATILPDLEAVERDPQREDVPIEISLRERRTQRATFGLGFSTDKGMRGLAGYDKLNMFDRGWVADAGVQAESLQYVAFGNLRTPTDRHGYYDRGGVRAERLDVQGELTDTSTAYIGRGKRSERLEQFTALQYQTERRAIQSDAGDITRNSEALSLTHAWMLRRVDSQIDPHRGFTLNAQVTGGGTGASLNRIFVRLYGRLMHFLPMPDSSILADGLLVSRIEGGWVSGDSLENIPSENLFRTGGSTTVRGYPYLGLGVAQGSAVVGGRVLGVASLEYQHPIRPTWAGAVFVDAGSASLSWDEFKPALGAGVGVRWRSPVGPVNVDLAYGEQVRRWRLHLSVGYTF